MLQISPGKDIIIEFIRQEDYKYVRCLGAMYLRLTGKAVDIYQYLEVCASKEVESVQMKSDDYDDEICIYIYICVLICLFSIYITESYTMMMIMMMIENPFLRKYGNDANSHFITIIERLG